MQQVKNYSTNYLLLGLNQVSTNSDSINSNTNCILPMSIIKKINENFRSLIPLSSLQKVINKERAGEIVILKQGIEQIFSNLSNTPSEDIKNHLKNIWTSTKWDYFRLEKAIYEDTYPGCSPNFKLLTVAFGKQSYLCHLFRKAVFSKLARYTKESNEIVKIYAHTEFFHFSDYFSAVLTEAKLLNTDNTTTKIALTQEELHKATEFYLDFPPLNDSIKPSHYKVESFQTSDCDLTETQISQENLEQITKAITADVELHLRPYLTKNIDYLPKNPLFENLKNRFKINQYILLDIALEAYCRSAFRVLYAWKSPEYMRTVPQIYRDPNDARKFINYKDDERWYQCWTGTTSPKFAKEFYHYLRALGPAVYHDFGFFAPHPENLVDIALKQVQKFKVDESLIKKELEDKSSNYEMYRKIFTQKIQELVAAKSDVNTPFDQQELIDEEGQCALNWYKELLKDCDPQSDLKNPPFNLTVLKIIHLTAKEVQKNLPCSTRLSLENVIEWSKNIFFKEAKYQKFETESLFCKALTRDFNELLTAGEDLHTPFDLKEITDEDSFKILEWYESETSRVDDPPFNIVVLKQFYTTINAIKIRYGDLSGYTILEMQAMLQSILFKTWTNHRISTILYQNLRDLLELKKDIYSQFSKAESKTAEHEKIYNWYESFSPRSDIPPFNMLVLQQIYYTINQLEEECGKTIEIRMGDLKKLTLSLINKAWLDVRNELHSNFEHVLQNFSFIIDCIYMTDLTSEEQLSQENSDIYPDFRNWYYIWMGRPCPNYTLEMLQILLRFSPLTEQPDRIYTPNELERLILDNATKIYDPPQFELEIDEDISQ